MTKAIRNSLTGTYRSAGRTSDGVTMLAPKTKPTHFTAGEMRSTLRELRRDGAGRFETKSASERAASAGECITRKG